MGVDWGVTGRYRISFGGNENAPKIGCGIMVTQLYECTKNL